MRIRWPAGQAHATLRDTPTAHELALPYGPTPVSEAQECRLVSAVNLLGALEEEAPVLASVVAGNEIRVECVDG